MFQHVKLTEFTREELELENNTLKRLLHEYVAEVEILKKVFNEQYLEWSKEKQLLLDQVKLPDHKKS